MSNDPEPGRKPKRPQLEVPDRQLARAFGYTGADLAANRAGFQSWGQVLGLPPGWRWPALARLVPVLARPSPVQIACGRARLEHHIREHFGFFRIDFEERFTLTIDGCPHRFPLTALQHAALIEGLPYQVYYAVDSPTIYAIERASAPCP